MFSQMRLIRLLHQPTEDISGRYESELLLEMQLESIAHYAGVGWLGS